MIRHPKDNIRKQSVQDSIRKIRGQPHTHTHTHTRFPPKRYKKAKLKCQKNCGQSRLPSKKILKTDVRNKLPLKNIFEKTSGEKGTTLTQKQENSQTSRLEVVLNFQLCTCICSIMKHWVI